MQALEQAIEILEAQGFDRTWEMHDDLCDCIFQRMGSWYNPYIGERLDVRLCCIWADIYKSYPQFVKVTKTEPAEWNGEDDMPAAVWHRQLANHLGMPVAEVRGLGLEPPRGKPRAEKSRLFLPLGGGEYMEFVLG